MVELVAVDNAFNGGAGYVHDEGYVTWWVSIIVVGDNLPVTRFFSISFHVGESLVYTRGHMAIAAPIPRRALGLGLVDMGLCRHAYPLL